VVGPQNATCPIAGRSRRPRAASPTRGRSLRAAPAAPPVGARARRAPQRRGRAHAPPPPPPTCPPTARPTVCCSARTVLHVTDPDGPLPGDPVDRLAPEAPPQAAAHHGATGAASREDVHLLLLVEALAHVDAPPVPHLRFRGRSAGRTPAPRLPKRASAGPQALTMRQRCGAGRRAWRRRRCKADLRHMWCGFTKLFDG